MCWFVWNQIPGTKTKTELIALLLELKKTKYKLAENSVLTGYILDM